MQPARIFPLGENAVTVEFGAEMSEPLNNAARSLAAYFETNPFPGFIEAVPAIASTTIFFRSPEVRKNIRDGSTAFDLVSRLVQHAAGVNIPHSGDTRTVEVPVSFAPNDAPDLPYIAQTHGLSQDEVIGIFLAADYRVYMLGFLPGFAYLGIVDERIATPRKETPRTSVPKGSIGIAGRQTGIYPSASPGGWQLIGRTSIELITSDAESPCLLRPGDTVRFVRSL